MPTRVSTNMARKLTALAAEAPLVLIDLLHPQLTPNIYVVVDNAEVTSGGQLYQPIPLEFTWVSDNDKDPPSASITIDNADEVLTPWLEVSGGGRGATVVVKITTRDDPNTIDLSRSLELSDVKEENGKVTGRLGFNDLINKKLVAAIFNRVNAPGLYTQ